MPSGVSGYFDIEAEKGFTLRVSYSETYDIETNKSVVSLSKLQVRSASGSWGYYGWQYYPDGYIKINGQMAMDAESALPTHEVGVDSTNTWYTVTGNYKSVTVEHNNDGSKSVTIAVNLRWYTPSGNGGSGWSTVDSKTITLTKIHRASTVKASNGTIGSAVAIDITRAVSSFTHTVTLTLGKYSKSATKVGGSASITPDMEWCNALPNATKGTATILCITYSGTTEIGRKSINITLSVPASVKPTVRNLGTGVNLFEGLFLQGKSSIKIDTEASGVYGSTVKSVITTGAGYTANGKSVTIGPLNLSGDVVFTTTVTDSRGRSASDTVKRTVIAYQKPTISILACFRAKEDGTLDPAGESLWAKAKATFAPVNGKNAISLSVAYGEGDTDYFGEGVALVSGEGKTVFIGQISAKSAYTVQFKAVDAVGESADAVSSITSSTNYLITALRRYVALCGYVDESLSPGAQVVGDIHGSCDLFLSGLSVGQHLLVDSVGANWIRYMGGVQMCWGTTKALPDGQDTMQTGEKWGSLYHMDYELESPEFPQPFNYTPHVFVNPSDASVSGMIASVTRTTTEISKIKVLRPDVNNYPMWVSYLAIGVWDGNPWHPEVPEKDAEPPKYALKNQSTSSPGQASTTNGGIVWFYDSTDTTGHLFLDVTRCKLGRSAADIINNKDAVLVIPAGASVRYELTEFAYVGDSRKIANGETAKISARTANATTNVAGMEYVLGSKLDSNGLPQNFVSEFVTTAEVKIGSLYVVKFGDPGLNIKFRMQLTVNGERWI